MKFFIISALALTCSMAFAQNSRIYETTRGYNGHYQSYGEQRNEKNMAINRLEHEIINERRLLDYDLRDRDITNQTYNFFSGEYDALLSRVQYLKSRPEFSWQELTGLQQRFNYVSQLYNNFYNKLHGVID